MTDSMTRKEVTGPRTFGLVSLVQKITVIFKMCSSSGRGKWAMWDSAERVEF